MKKNGMPRFIFLLIVSLILIYFSRINRPGESIDPDTLNPKSSAGSKVSKIAIQSTSGEKNEVVEKLDLLTLSDGYRWNPRDEADWKKALPFELLGPGTTSARVVDASGKVLIGSTDKRSLYELGVSPGLKRLVVSLGDGLSKVLEPESGLEIDLPATPSGANMVGFSAWNWVSDDVLLATSGVQALDEAGKPVSCCEGHNLEATHLYAFRISTRTLFPVRNPESLGSPLFTINRVSHDGFVELVTSETHSDAGNRSSWFSIK